MLFVFIITLFCALTPAYSAVEIRAISGGSNYDNINFKEIWGVSLGPIRDNTSSAYNSCIVTQDNTGFLNDSFSGCSEKRVNGSFPVNITFLENSDFENSRNAVAYIVKEGSGSATNSSAYIQLYKNPQSVSKGQVTSVSFTWRELCNQSGGSFDTAREGCDKNIDVTVKIGLEEPGSTGVISGGWDIRLRYLSVPIPTTETISATSESPNYGFINASLFPGDSGAYIDYNTSDNPNVTRALSSSYSVEAIAPSTNGGVIMKDLQLQITHLGFFFFADHPSYLNGTSILSAFLPTATSFTPEDPGFINDQISAGLTNGKTYYYRAVTRDSSGAVLQLFDSSYCPQPITDLNNLNGCKTIITPAQVIGLISESSCFITTLTYGSAQTYQVKTFREFRSKILRPHVLGKKVIALYNQYGPKGATWVRKNPWVKPILRIGFYPLYLFSKLSLKFGFILTTLAFLSLPLFLIVFIRRIKK